MVSAHMDQSLVSLILKVFNLWVEILLLMYNQLHVMILVLSSTLYIFESINSSSKIQNING